MSVDLSRLVDFVEAFPRQTILLLGDFVADEFSFGEISRVSREAPVLILRHRETQLLPGGGANAANNLADLGARVLPVAPLGEDAPGRALLEYFRRKHVDTSAMVRVPGWTTPTKTRFLAGWTHTTRQQVLRVDRVADGGLPLRVREALLRKAQERLRRARAVLISDYGCGAATPALVRRLTRRASNRMVVALDSRYALLDYRSSGITAATPNEPELESLHHARIGNDFGALERLAGRTLRQMKLQALLVTRGKDGMVVFEQRRKPYAIPIYGTDQVADVTGAGDTVIAVFTLALAAGATFVEAAHLANYAGGIVVMKRGTATVTREELLAAIRNDATSTAGPPAR
ncbi:MAG TPA: PfkB family carbohydrate kinase [Candidatus Acidoferrales bacterium]|nr:PfkB family carbohydrate kinase [Candidatus Acidoferrales bacterium]